MEIGCTIPAATQKCKRNKSAESISLLDIMRVDSMQHARTNSSQHCRWFLGKTSFSTTAEQTVRYEISALL